MAVKLPIWLTPNFVVLVLAALMFVANVVWFVARRELSFVDSLYFTVVTLTTIGYGDIVPKTRGGRIVVAMSAFSGVILFGMMLGAISSQTVDKMHKLLERMLIKKGIVDPYVQVTHEIRQQGACNKFWRCGRPVTMQYRTATLHRNANPVWEDPPTWSVPVAWMEDAPGPTPPPSREHTFSNSSSVSSSVSSSDSSSLEVAGVISLTVYDWDRLTADDVIGVALVPVVWGPHWRSYSLPVELSDEVDESQRDHAAFVDVEILAEADEHRVQLRVLRATDLPEMDHDSRAEAAASLFNQSLEWMTGIVICVVALLVCAAVIGRIEEWRFSNSVYFIFISMNGVGFGDFSPKSVAGRLVFIPIAVVLISVRGYAIAVVSAAWLGTSAQSLLSNVDRRPGAETRCMRQKRRLQLWLRSPSGRAALQFFVLMVCIVAITLVGAAIFPEIEKAQHLQYSSCIYFMAVVLSTVGYGDILPQTGWGKFFCVVVSTFGGVLVAFVLNILSERRLAFEASSLLKRASTAGGVAGFALMNAAQNAGKKSSRSSGSAARSSASDSSSGSGQSASASASGRSSSAGSAGSAGSTGSGGAAGAAGSGGAADSLSGGSSFSGGSTSGGSYSLDFSETGSASEGVEDVESGSGVVVQDPDLTRSSWWSHLDSDSFDPATASPLQIFVRFLRHWSGTKFVVMTITYLGVNLIAAAIYNRLENLGGFGTALYFSLVTSATIGYGDFTPKTKAGRAFTIFFLLFNVLLYGYIAMFLQRALEEIHFVATTDTKIEDVHRSLVLAKVEDARKE